MLPIYENNNDYYFTPKILAFFSWALRRKNKPGFKEGKKLNFCVMCIFFIDIMLDFFATSPAEFIFFLILYKIYNYALFRFNNICKCKMKGPHNYANFSMSTFTTTGNFTGGKSGHFLYPYKRVVGSTRVIRLIFSVFCWPYEFFFKNVGF